MRTFWQFVGILLLIGFVGAYFWWIASVLAVVALAWGAHKAFAEIAAEDADEAKRQAEIVARADRQHAQTLKGDPRGVYGAGWAARRAYQRALKR